MKRSVKPSKNNLKKKRAVTLQFTLNASEHKEESKLNDSFFSIVRGKKLIISEDNKAAFFHPVFSVII